MTDQPGGGRRQPPADDRTLLDPLNADELKALREARQKLQAAKGDSSAVAHQAVIGPDAGEDIGDAPTRAMPALPQFDNPGVTLETIATRAPVEPPQGEPPRIIKPPATLPARAQRGLTPSSPRIPDPALAPLSRPLDGPMAGPKPQEPMSVLGPTLPPQPKPPVQRTMPVPGPGQGGFGENTLLWMAPPKVPQTLTQSGQTGEFGKGRSSPKRVLGLVGGIAALALVFAGLVWAVFGKKERGVIDLHTNPPRASVKINGTKTKNLTPMKLNLVEGTWEIEIDLEGYRPNVFSVTIEAGAQPIRKDIELEPISKAGLASVAIAVQPVASNITVDGQTYAAKRSLNLPNLDPNAPHKISIEAGGYVKIEQEIPPGQLKKSYSFYLQQDENR